MGPKDETMTKSSSMPFAESTPVAEAASDATGAPVADSASEAPVEPLPIGGRLPVAEFEAVLAVLKRMPAFAAQTRDDAIAVLNGAVGDQLVDSASDLSLPMEIRTADRALDFSRELGDQLSNPSPHLVILVHGLMVTERYWWMGGGADFGSRLASDVGPTPLYLRFNTGRHISENGREFSMLLDQLVAKWPVAVQSISFVGHSMGGLVCRSATHYATEVSVGNDEVERRVDEPAAAARPGAWLPLLRRLFLVGVPARGAPLELLTHVATFTLKVIPNPWTIFIGWAVNKRSAGIKDLRHGFLVDEEWRGRNPDALSFQRRFPVPLTPGVQHFVLAATLAEDPEHPLARIFGDALVTPWSAKDERLNGAGASRLAADIRLFPKMVHARLGWDDEVYAQILDWWNSESENAT